MDVAVVADGLEKSIIANKYPLCMGKHRGYKDYYWDCISYSQFSWKEFRYIYHLHQTTHGFLQTRGAFPKNSRLGKLCWREYNLSLIHTDAADDLLCVDLGGRRIIKKKKKKKKKKKNKKKKKKNNDYEDIYK